MTPTMLRKYQKEMRKIGGKLTLISSEGIINHGAAIVAFPSGNVGVHGRGDYAMVKSACRQALLSYGRGA